MTSDEARSGASATRGLPPEEAGRTVRDYFAAFSWVPPALDASKLSAREFLAAVDDAARTVSDEPDE